MLESQKKLENQLNEIENIESSDEKLLSIIDAIESAIYISSPLPITDNYEMYKRYFQKFDLYFSPEE